jgi:raffinose/stachyose/melibiose transport system permease protein
MKKNVSVKLIIYSFIFLMMLLYLFPLFYVFNTSLKTEPEFIRSSVSLAKSFHIQNFATAWERAHFQYNIFNSLFYMVTCTALSIMLAVLLAFPIARKFLKYGNLILGLFIAGMFLPDGIIPQFQLLLRLHLYNTRIGYMLGMIGGGGVTLLFFVAYIKGIPKDFDEASSIDGCGYFRYIFSILIPLMKPAIASMAILTAIGIWNDVIRAVIFLSDSKLFPITRGLYVFTGEHNNQWTLQSAALIIVAAPIIIIYVFLQRYIIDGVLSGAIKA